LAATALFHLRAYGTGHVPRSGGVLLAANHQSVLDPVLVAACVPREVHFMARRDLFGAPLFGAFIRALHAFPVERGRPDRAALREAVARLRRGVAVLVFPEGTRTRTGRLGAPRPGVWVMARLAGVPVIPVRIEGAWNAWPPGKVLPRLRPVNILFSPPIRAGARADLAASWRALSARPHRRVGTPDKEEQEHGEPRAGA
jgi:1-acyl-sn-glycerol-3-phosphate acyltransferase